MMERIKTLFTSLKYAWKYSETLTSVLRHLSKFPGIEYADDLRAWLRPVVLDFSTLTSLTKNTIDDAIARTAVHIIDCDKAWAAVYSILMLARDRGSDDGVLVPMDELQNDAVDSFYEISDAVPTESPAIVIAAIGLIIQLVQLLRR